MADNGQGQRVLFNHVGVCVTDLERSRRFYEEVLDFKYWWEFDAPDDGTAELLQIPAPVGLKAVYLVRDGFVLELLDYRSAGTVPGDGRVMNQPGLTHISVAVADIPGLLDKVVPLGGEIIEKTNMGGQAIMIRDPDGQLIELTSLGFQDMRPPWPS